MEVIAESPWTYCGDAISGLEVYKTKESVSLLGTELGVFRSLQWTVFYEFPQGVQTAIQQRLSGRFAFMWFRRRLSSVSYALIFKQYNGWFIL